MKNESLYLVLAVVAGVLTLGYLGKRAAGAVGDAVGSAAKAVGAAVNPTSADNLAYRGTNAVGAAVTGDPSFSLGTWIYDAVNPPKATPETTKRPAVAKGPKPPAANVPKAKGGGITVLPAPGAATGSGGLVPATVVERVDPFYF